MKKSIFATIILVLVIAFPILTMAQEKDENISPPQQQLEERQKLAKVFKVSKALAVKQVPLMRSISFALSKDHGDTIKEGKSDKGMAKPDKGEIFIEVSWELAAFNVQPGFKTPNDILVIRLKNGTTIRPIARHKAETSSGLFWFPALEQMTYTEGGKVEETWLFSVPTNSLHTLQFDCFGQSGPIKVQNGGK